MRPGPRPGGAPRVDFRIKAMSAWGSAPDWVLRLAEACNSTSQTSVAKALGYSGATISQVLSNSYAGDLDRVAGMVRGHFMAETVVCPMKGEMGRDDCLRWQAKPFAATSADRVRMFHACRSGCPHSKHTRETDDA